MSSQVLPGARGARLTAELPAYAAPTPDPAPVQPYPGRAQPTPWGPGLRALPSSPNEVTKGRVDQWILLLGQKRLPYSANLSSSFFSFFLIYLFAWKFIIDIPNCMHVCVRACARVPLWNGVTRAHRNAASNTRAVALPAEHPCWRRRCPSRRRAPRPARGPLLSQQRRERGPAYFQARSSPSNDHAGSQTWALPGPLDV